MEIPDIEAKSAWIKDGERVRSEMENFHDQGGHPYPTMGRASPGQLAQFDGTPCVLFEVEPFNGPRYPVAVVWDGRRFVVDWESLTAYGTMDWSEWIESRPAITQTIRAFARQASRDFHPTTSGQTGFLLEHRDSPTSQAAVASGEIAERLTALTDRARAPVTVDVSFQPAGPGESPVAVITRLAHPGWSR